MSQTHRQRVTFYTLPAELGGPHALAAPDGGAAVSQEPTAQTVANQLPGLAWTTDLELRITFAQGSALNFLDRHADEIVGQSLFDFLHTQDAEFAPIAAHRCALGGQAMNFDFPLGQRRFLGLVEPLFDKHGDLGGTITNALDITDYHRLQESRRDLEVKARELEKVNCLKLFAGGVAHNFNNMLTVMLGYTTLARSRLPVDSPVHIVLNEIEATAQTAADLTAQLLVYGQKTPSETQPVCLSRLAEELRPRLRACLREGVVLQTDLADPLPAVRGDAGQLQRLVLTLFFNACEAIGAKPGVISLWTRDVRLTGQFCAEVGLQPPLSDGHYVWLQVSDTGCGMDEDTRARLFEPFYSTKFTGRGLGLAAAHGIVQQHGGAMAVSSKAGLGSTFHVLLPCAAPR